MATVRITAVQMLVTDNLEENLRQILLHLNKHDSDYMVFPEMCLTGHQGGFSERSTESAWEKIADACRKRYTTAVVGTGCHENGARYNQVRIYSDAGELLGTQEKIVPTRDERAWCHPGEELRLFEHGELPFGCLVGNDLWVAPGMGPYPDPRLSCRLGERGARLIFHSAHSGIDADYAAYYESNLALRARESGCYILVANAAAPSGKLNAPTGALGPDGRWIVTSPREGEQVCHVDIELD